MMVCDYCSSEDIAYEDMDGIEAYCKECYHTLDKEYIEANGIRGI